jgi:hypothetical protein
MMRYGLVAGIIDLVVVLFVDVAVEHGKPDEEGNTNQVFHAFDVRVIIYQGEHFLDLAY